MEIKNLEEEIEEALGINKSESLHPPIAPSPVASEKEPSEGSRMEKGFEPQRSEGVHTLRGDSKLAIDFTLDQAFDWLMDNSSFRRSMIEFVKKLVPGYEGKYHRFSKEEMDRAFVQKRKENKIKLEVVRSLPPDLLQELKEKIKGRKIE